MNFDNKFDKEWKNEGTEPAQSFFTSGFSGGLKPPAQYFNWFWSKVIKVITEIQTKLTGEETARTNADTALQDDIDTHTGDNSNPHRVTKAQVGLGNCDNTSDKDKPISTATQSALNRRQPIITGGATSITSLDLTANRALISNSVGKVGVSAVTSTELGYLDGVTSNVQTQLNDKQPKLDDASTNFLSWIIHNGNDDFSFEGDFNFNYTPTIGGVDIATVDDVNNKANIKKNPDDTTGDIIDTHLTVGVRQGGSTCGTHSFTSGLGNAASGPSSCAIGDTNMVSGASSCAIGSTNTVSEAGSFASGTNNTASGLISFASGTNNTASGSCSFASGQYNTASGICSFVAGNNNAASGDFSFVSGIGNIANMCQSVFGKYNKDTTGTTGSTTTGNVFVVGCGTSRARDNALRITADGTCYGKTSFKASGADYAEYFEWKDGNPNNEDRRGLFVTLDGEKIKVANDGDYIVGIISGNPSMCGNTHSETWKNMYLKDVFGTYITDENGNLQLNPKCDHTQEYVSRENRKEWSPVGIVGRLVVIDDGTCKVNGYCKPINGIATKSNSGYRVINRIDDSHIEVLLK